MATVVGSASPPCPPAVRSNACSPGISEEGQSPDSASSSTPTGRASATPTPLVVDTALAQGAQWEGDDLGARILALTSPASAPANLGLWPEGEGDAGSNGWGSRVSSPALSLTGGFGNLPSLPTPSPIPVGPSLASLATTFAPIASPTVPLPAPDFSWLTNLASSTSATPSPTHTASSRSSPVQEPMAAMVATMLGMIESEESRQRVALVGNEADEHRVLAGMAPKSPSPLLSLQEEQRLLAQQEAQVNQLFGSLLEPVVQQPQQQAPPLLQPHVLREATNVPTRPPAGKAPFAPTISRGAVHIMDKCGTRMPVCLDYLKGMCGHKRSRCKFAHPQLPQATAELLRMEKDGRQVCALWVLTGYCKFGDKCRDMHPVLPEGIANGAFNTNFNAAGNPLGGEAPEAPAAPAPAPAPEASSQREAFGTTLDQNKLQQQRQAALAAAASVGFGAPQNLGFGGFKPAAQSGNGRNPFSSLDNRFNKERGNTRKEGGFRTKKPVVNSGDAQAPTNAHGLLRPVSPQK